MNHLDKISPAFEPFLADSGPNDRREAIVIYNAPENKDKPVRGRLREREKRTDGVQERAAAHRTAQQELFQGYEKTAGKMLVGNRPLEVAPVGDSVLPVAAVEVTRTTLPALAAKSNVAAIMPNQKIRLIQPKQVNYDGLMRKEAKDGMTWGLKALGIPELWQATKGNGVNVAVLDTGVYGDHEALKGRVKDFIVIDSLGRRIVPDKTFDGGQHGTHVCGTIAGGKTESGISIGVAPEVNLLVAGVLLGEATLRTLVEGIAWAVEQDADIINISLGFSYFEPLFNQVFKMLLDEFSVLPVVAIGNENYGNSSSPGNAPTALSVGAVEKVSPKISGHRLDVAFFSSGASLVFPGETEALVTKPDVVAPGSQVYSSIPPEKRPDGTYRYAFMDGTSMATPHVAGAAALLMAAKPEASAADVIKALKQTAKHPRGTDFRPDNRWGNGVIQPVKALEALG